MAAFWVILGVAIVMAIMFVVLQGSNKPILSFFLKGLASAFVLILGLYGAIFSGILTKNSVTDIPGFLFLLGLGFCLVGDLFLQIFDMNGVKEKYKIINIGSFAFTLAHFGFIAAMVLLVKSSILAIIIPVLCGLVITFGIYFMQKPMKLDYNKSTPNILVYSLALATSVSFSVSNVILNGFTTFNIMLMIGMILFFVSDLILSMIYFKKEENRKLYYPNLGIYYIAIIVIASALFVM